MKESYAEGLAAPSHAEFPARGVSKRWQGVRADRVLSRERRFLRDTDAVGRRGRHHRTHRYREMRLDPARPETPCTYGNTSHENREVLCWPAADGAAGRVGKSKAYADDERAREVGRSLRQIIRKTTGPAGPVNHFILRVARRRGAKRIRPWRFLVELTSRRSNVTINRSARCAGSG